MVDPLTAFWTKHYSFSAFPKSIRETSDNGFLIVADSIIFKINISGDSLWTKKLDNIICNGDDSFQKLSSGYVIVGNTSTSEPNDIHLITINETGSILMNKIYSNAGMAFAVQPTLDGGYIIAGSKANQVMLLKTDADGNTGE
jgi:hypothetical protein